MPWMLDPETGDSRRPHWSAIVDENDEPQLPKDWADADNIPSADTWPLRFLQTSKHKTLPDIMGGRFSFTIFVSQAFRELIEAMDPVKHHYIPLHLNLYGGRESIGEYFLFKHGMFVDGIIAEQSQVGGIYDSDNNLAFYSVAAHPKIVWRASEIAGRHVWTDKYLPQRFFCSDQFQEEVKKRKMKLFLKTQSFVAETHSS